MMREMNCSMMRSLFGEAYPRRCFECGLGPCRRTDEIDRLLAEDANEHPTCAATVERQQPSQGTRLQPGSRVVGEAGAGPGETGVEGC